MRIGVFLLAARYPGQDDEAALARAVEATVAAERAGFDDVWVSEHHFMSYGVCPSAITLAGFLLGATSRIEVGTAVSVLSSQHPVALAEQAAMLAAVSGGRFRLGVGRGGPWRDLEVFGTGLERYETGFAEGLDLVLEWLRRERVSAGGPTFRFREVPVVPRVRRPPPVAVACTSPATEALAARRGLPMLLGMHVGDEEKAAAVARYAAIAGIGTGGEAGTVTGDGTGTGDVTGGPSPAVVPHIATGLAQVADSRADAVDLLCREMPRWLGPGLAGYVPVDDRPRPALDPEGYVRRLCDLHAVGSPADCARSLLGTAARTGIRHLLLLVEGAGSHERTIENIERLGADVLPRVRISSPGTPATG